MKDVKLLLKATGIEKEGHNGNGKIARIYLISDDGERINGGYDVEIVYDLMEKKQKSIYVDRAPYPKLCPVNRQGTKYVRSARDDRTERDNLLDLPEN